jgi:hypothetical protein
LGVPPGCAQGQAIRCNVGPGPHDFRFCPSRNTVFKKRARIETSSKQFDAQANSKKPNFKTISLLLLLGKKPISADS